MFTKIERATPTQAHSLLEISSDYSNYVNIKAVELKTGDVCVCGEWKPECFVVRGMEENGFSVRVAKDGTIMHVNGDTTAKAGDNAEKYFTFLRMIG